MGVARKWHFSTSGGAANLGGVSGDLFEHRGSGIPLLGITSLFMHKLTGLYYLLHNEQSSFLNLLLWKSNVISTLGTLLVPLQVLYCLKCISII